MLLQFITLHTSNYVLYYVVFKVSEYMFISFNVQKCSLNTDSNKKQTKIICQMEKHNLWGISNKQEHSMLCYLTVYWQGSAPRTQLSWLQHCYFMQKIQKQNTETS